MEGGGGGGSTFHPTVTPVADRNNNKKSTVLVSPITDTEVRIALPRWLSGQLPVVDEIVLVRPYTAEETAPNHRQKSDVHNGIGAGR